MQNNSIINWHEKVRNSNKRLLSKQNAAAAST